MEGYIEAYIKGKKEDVEKVINYLTEKSNDETNERIKYQTFLSFFRNIDVLEKAKEGEFVELFIDSRERYQDVCGFFDEIVKIEPKLKIKGYSYHARHLYAGFYSGVGADYHEGDHWIENYSSDIYFDYECDGDWWEPNESFRYEQNIDGSLIILKYYDWYKEITIPEKINGKMVTELGSALFMNNEKITSIKIPSCVTTIGKNAFWGCKNLVIYGEKGSCAEKAARENRIPFSTGEEIDASNLEYIYEENDDYVEIYAYRGNEKDVVIPEEINGKKVTIIKDRAFYGEHIETVVCPDTVTTMEDGVFSTCRSLKNVTLSKNITSIGDYMFADCRISELKIPETVTSIGKYAFTNCYYLKELVIPQNVKTLGTNAFHNSGVKKVTFPNSLKTLGTSGLFNTEIEEIILEDNNPNFTFEDGVLYSKDKKQLISCLKKIEKFDLNRDTEILGAKAFAASKYSLKKISIPFKLKKLGKDALTPNIKEIIIKDAVIGETTVDIPIKISFEVTSKVDSAIRKCLKINKDKTFFDFEAYDKCFKDLKTLKDKLTFSLNRLRFPIKLSESNKELYTSYVSKSEKKGLEVLINENDLEAIISMEAIKNGFTRKNLDSAIELANNLDRGEILAHLMNYKNEKFATKDKAFKL